MGNVEGGGPIDRDVFERMFQSMQHDLESSRHSNVQVERFKTGDRVVMHGLERVGLNGRFGLVLNPAPTADNRYHIRLEDTGDEVRAKKKNFTKIVTKPPHIIDVGEEEEGPTDTDQLLIGDCCVCLGEQRATEACIPCGHLVLCQSCGPRCRDTRGKCPFCRAPILELIKIQMPSESKDQEIEKAVIRTRKAEQRQKELEHQLARYQEGAKSNKRMKRSPSLAPNVGDWVQMPRRDFEVDFLNKIGVITQMGTSYTISFQCADETAYVAQGIKQPGASYRNLEVPIETVFQRVYTPVEANWLLPQQDKYCVFADMMDEKKKKGKRK